MDTQLLLLLAPLLAVEVGLRIWTLFVLRRTPRVRGNRTVWAVVVLLVGLAWAAFLLFGREEAE